MTEADLAALPYATNPFSQGINADDYKAQRTTQNGWERVRHWMAFANVPENAVGPNGEQPERNGKLYIENMLSPEVRVLITETEREVFDAEFGLLSRGHASIACFPDEIDPARGDRFTLLDKLFLARVAVSCSGDATDDLGRRFVSEIVSVIADSGTLDSSAYFLQDEDKGKIEWVGVPPQWALVSLHYFPSFVYLDVSDRNPPRGTDGNRLLIRGLLTWEKN